MACALVTLALMVALQVVQSVKSPCIVVSLSCSTSPTSIQPPCLSLKARNDTITVVTINPKVEFDAVVDFVSRTFHSRNLDCSEVIGVVGELDVTTASIIHTVASRANLNITLVSAVAPSTFLPPTNLALPNLLHMNPLTHYVEALAAFLDHLNWTRIGLISENTPYHQFTAELVQQKLAENPERRIIPFVSVNSRDNKAKVIQAFRAYETDVIFVSACDSMALSLIQEASRVGSTWPEYAWILFDASFDLLVSQEGVISLTDQKCYHRQRGKCADSSFFMNAISAVVSAESHSSNTSFSEVSKINFRGNRRLNNISIIQSYGETIGVYNSESQQLSDLGPSFLADTKPRGTILQIHNQYFAPVVTLVVLSAFSLFVLVSIVLTLYVCFRKEPEIKATSVTVSLNMFLGCYILILYMLFLVLLNEHRLCDLLLLLSFGGLPLPLIMATLFVKVLRIFLIFFKPYSYKKKLFSDPLLFLYILLLLTPSFVILTTWLSADPYTLIEQNYTSVNFIFTYPRCRSKHTALWLSIHLFYWIILCCALVCLAVKTSRLRYKHFTDTKATNAFIFLTIYFVTLALIHWYFIFNLQKQDTSTQIASDGVLYVVSCILVLLCQGLLFMPKVYPPLKRRLTQKFK